MTIHRTSRWTYLARLSAIGCISHLAAACGSGDPEGDAKKIVDDARKDFDSGKGGSSAATSRGGASSSATATVGASTSSGGSASWSSATAGRANTAGTPGAATAAAAGTASLAGSAGTSGSKSCIPSPDPDVPDSEGLDTNCDGIDGNAAASVFVSPYGLDSASGTKSDPVRSIGKAVQLAKGSSGKLADVLVCTGTYRENVVVSETALGLHGGYDCNTWQRTPSNTLLAPSTGVALRIVQATKMEVSKFNLESADATNPGESSQAVQVINSKAVRIVGSNIVAGRGAPGVSAPPQAKNWLGTKARKGATGEALAVGGDGSLGCHASTHTVDVDFDGKVDKGNDTAEPRCTVPRTGGVGDATTCGELDTQTVQGGKGGSAAVKLYNAAPLAWQAGNSGLPERPIPRPTAGTPGANFGRITEKGYEATNQGGNGKQGQAGISGRGGLGGGSCLVRSGNIEEGDTPVTVDMRVGFTCDASVRWGAEHWADVSMPYKGTTVTMFPGSGGGQGGYGGCGGYGGFGGGGGGASIALVVFESELTLSRCNVTSDLGGKGGAPSAGTAGQAGGDGGEGGSVMPTGAMLPMVNGKLLIEEAKLKGSPGANGASGEAGGPGGAGGGGPSIGILWSGSTEPALDTTVTVKGGSGGDGGTPTGAGDPGKSGLQGDVVKAP